MLKAHLDSNTFSDTFIQGDLYHKYMKESTHSDVSCVWKMLWSEEKSSWMLLMFYVSFQGQKKLWKSYYFCICAQSLTVFFFHCGITELKNLACDLLHDCRPGRWCSGTVYWCWVDHSVGEFQVFSHGEPM